MAGAVFNQSTNLIVVGDFPEPRPTNLVHSAQPWLLDQLC